MWSSCTECSFLSARAPRWNSLAMQEEVCSEVCSTRGEILLFICGDIVVLNSFADYLFPNMECPLSSIPFECLPSVRMWPKIQKWKNAKTQKSKNTKNTIPPECRYALVEWIVPSEVWDHHSVLPCLCRKHLDYKKKNICAAHWATQPQTAKDMMLSSIRQ